MYVEILTPDVEIYKGEATALKFPGTDGSFGVLKNHAPLIASLKAGKVSLTDMNKNEQVFDIKGGLVEVLNNKVIVLAE